MEENTQPAADTDAYYGNESADGDIDMSFLDEKPQH